MRSQRTWWRFYFRGKKCSLRSRRLKVVGARKNGSARVRHARGEGAPSPLACLPLVGQFFLAPTTSKRLLRWLEKVPCEL